MRIVIEEGQTIYDVAIAAGGSMDSVFDLLNENPALATLDTPLISGMELNLKTVRNQEIGRYYADRKMKINSYNLIEGEDTGGSFDGSFDDSFN